MLCSCDLCLSILSLIALAVILEDKLYFTGGDYTFDGGDTTSTGTAIATSYVVEYKVTRWQRTSYTGSI